MFKKLVASVTLSPSAIGDLAAYSKKLKVQTPYRIAASIFIFAALILEIVVINVPIPTATPAKRTPTDMSVTKSTENLKYSLETRNISQGNTDATKSPAQSADQLIYTLNVKNTSDSPQLVRFSIDLQDVFDYASLLGNNNAALNNTILEWPETTIEPGQNQVRTFTIKMTRDISTAPMNGLAYDCKMTTAFGSIQHNVVRCSTVKALETELDALPRLNNITSISIISVALITSLFLLFKNIQERKEIKIIRNQLTEGSI